MENLKGKGRVSIELRNLISAATCLHGRPDHQRTLAHENIRKQGKFPNIAEISLSEGNARVALDGHFFPDGRLLSI
jgi:hypothetical protein